MYDVSLPISSPFPFCPGLLPVFCCKRLIYIDYIWRDLCPLASCWVPPIRIQTEKQRLQENKEQGEDIYFSGSL